MTLEFSAQPENEPRVTTKAKTVFVVSSNMTIRVSYGAVLNRAVPIMVVVVVVW